MAVNPLILEAMKKKHPELFGMGMPAPIAPSSFDVGVSNSTAAARGATPPPAPVDPQFKLTMDDLTRPSVASQLLKNPPPMPDVPKPPTMPAPQLGGTGGSNGMKTAKAPPPMPEIPQMDAPPPAPTGPSDRDKLSASLDKKKKWALIASAIAGLGDAVTARGGGKSNFAQNALAGTADMKERGLKEFDEGVKAKKTAESDAEMNSATSPVSRSYQDAVLKLNPKMNEKQIRMLPASRLKDLLDTGEVVYKVDQARQVRDENKADKAALQDEKLALKKEQADEKNIQNLAKRLGDPQPLVAAMNNIEDILGFKIEDYDDKKGTVNGKEKDLPGVSIPGIGRTSFYSRDARELQSAAAKVFNLELRDRSGAAVTVPELERLKIEFASGRFNSEPELIKALKNYKSILATHLKNAEAGFNPELVETYRERGGVTSKDVGVRKAEPSSQDKEAIAWAQANPNDPRAKDILAANGL